MTSRALKKQAKSFEDAREADDYDEHDQGPPQLQQVTREFIGNHGNRAASACSVSAARAGAREN